MSNIARTFICVCIFLARDYVCAATICVESADAFTQALATAESNSQDNDIRLRAGLYEAPVSGWKIDLGDGSHSLAISGGYSDAACANRSAGAATTVLDGGHVVRPLTIDTSNSFGAATDAVSIAITGMTFRNGHDNVIGALKVSDPGPIFGGIIRIEGNIFLDNDATTGVTVDRTYAPALMVATDGPDVTGGTGIFLRNNVFARNTGPNSAALFAFTNNHIDATGNTFVENASTDTTLAERVTFDYFAISGASLSNNIFWHNNAARTEATYDVHFGLNWDSTNNDIESAAGTPANSVDDIQVPPMFTDAANADYSLLNTATALIDAGNDDPPGGLTQFDVTGQTRVVSAHVDIGAYEFRIRGNVIFDDGFDISP